MSLPFLTSAPGKVIIFGEHSAVYNKPAVAASVSALRTYLLISESSAPDTIELDFPDISFNHKWSINDFNAITEDQVNSQNWPRLNKPPIACLRNSLVFWIRC
ncbi:CFF_collapsed_G0043590.mRNA.1.CDS.1 [Saccharomyces cerevisiae]|nr:CFF_collapsed_G0043590.mRNA.1.CDS.1 [Saccharomyces cerevisiae]